MSQLDGLSLRPSDVDSKYNIKSIGMPRVIGPGNDVNVWQLWFQGRDSTAEDNLVNHSTGRIYYATSADGLSDWNIHPSNPILVPSNDEGNWWYFDSSHVGLGDIIQPGNGAQSKFVTQDGMYFMYTFGGGQDVIELPKSNASVKGAKMEIGLAVSQDGIHWSRVEGPSPRGSYLEVGKFEEFDGQFVGWPTVLEVAPLYKMYYSTYSPWMKRFVIGLAIAGDGLKWRKLGPVFSGGTKKSDFDYFGASRRHIVRLPSNEFRMWYEAIDADGKHSIGVASSADGFNWFKLSSSPVFERNPDVDAWDSGGVGSPHLIYLPEKKRWRMYYVGNALPKNEELSYDANTNELHLADSIGVAESIDEEGLVFTRVSR